MRTLATLVLIVVSLTGCGAPAEQATKLTIPAELIGCWTLNDPDKEADIKEQLTIEDKQMTVVASWMGGQPVPLTIDRIDSVSGSSFHGLVSYPENGERSTYATEIGIGIRGAPVDRLVVVEGDAGSRWHSRCEMEQ